MQYEAGGKETERRGCARIKLSRVGDDVPEILIQKGIVRLDAKLVAAMIYSDGFLEISFAKPIVLKHFDWSEFALELKSFALRGSFHENQPTHETKICARRKRFPSSQCCRSFAAGRQPPFCRQLENSVARHGDFNELQPPSNPPTCRGR